MKRFAVALLLLICRCTTHSPLVILATVDGPPAWPIGYLVGGTEGWPLVAHSDTAASLIAAVHEGFFDPWAYSPLGGLRGQGTLLTLAGREGWRTGLFAATSDTLRPSFEHLGRCAEVAHLYPSGDAGWRRALADVTLWAVTNRAPRFAAVHLSLENLSPGSVGAAALVEFWSTLERLVRGSDPPSTLVGVYLPDWSSPFHVEQGPRLRVFGSARGTRPSPGTPLSTLDVAPTVASILGLLYTPDYPGQSLTARGKGTRTEPVPMTRQGIRLVVGTRWMVVVDEFQDPALPARIRFFDLWRGEFSARGTRNPETISLLRAVPLAAEPLPQERQHPVP